MIRTIFLDAAGTLIEPAEPVAAVYARHFAAAGWEIGEGSIKEAFRSTFVSLGVPDYEAHADGDLAEREWWHRLVAETARRSGIDPSGEVFEDCFRSLFAHYEKGESWRIFPEVPEFLSAVRERGYRLAVVSNFDRRLHGILRDLDLAPAFEVIVTSADARCRKPGTAVFHQTLEHLGSLAPEAVHIGDNAVADGEGAAAAGLDSFILDRPAISLLDALCWLDCKK